MKFTANIHNWGIWKINFYGNELMTNGRTRNCSGWTVTTKSRQEDESQDYVSNISRLTLIFKNMDYNGTDNMPNEENKWTLLEANPTQRFEK